MNTTSRQYGFTLVETLISLFILSLALTGIFALLSSNFRVATSIKNSFVASALVQEGMEVMRNLRDEDWIAGRDFGSFGRSAPVGDNQYKVQWDSTELGLAPTEQTLSINSKGIYNYDPDPTNTPTQYYRAVYIKKITDYEIRVVVKVFWKGYFGEQSVSAEEHFFNWY